jgi:O-antigen ligase
MNREESLASGSDSLYFERQYLLLLSLKKLLFLCLHLKTHMLHLYKLDIPFYLKMEGTTLKRKQKHFTALVALLAIACFVLPLIVYLKIVPISASYKGYYGSASIDYDFFNYYKSIGIIFCGTILFLIFFYKMIKKEFIFNKSALYIPIFIYLTFCLLSTVMSKYSDVALFGYLNRREGLLVLMSYIVFFVVSSHIHWEKDIKIISISIVLSAIIVGIIGVFQFAGLDFFRSDIGKRVILHSYFGGLGKSLNFTFKEWEVYATMYNPNYVGSYTALIIPFLFPIFMFSKKVHLKIISCIAIAVLFVCLIGSHSRGGILGLLFVAFVFVLTAHKYVIRHYKLLLTFLIAVSAIVFTMNAVTGNALGKRILSLTNSSETGINKIINAAVENNDLLLYFNEGMIRVIADNDQIKFMDENSNLFKVSLVNNMISLGNDKYNDVFFKQGVNKEGIEWLQLVNGNTKLDFAITANGFKFLRGNNELMDIKPAKSLGIYKYDKFASNRGYIWSRSLPLLGNTLLVGHGPDTFAQYFPQDEYVAKQIVLDDSNIIIDKAHNFFLQMAMNTGVISLLAILTFFIIFFIQGIKLYFGKEMNDFNKIVGFGSFLGFCGYMVSMLVNDSVVSVAPLFWIIIGLGVSYSLKSAGSTNNVRR